jgi:hypothetical protein
MIFSLLLSSLCCGLHLSLNVMVNEIMVNETEGYFSTWAAQQVLPDAIDD